MALIKCPNCGKEISDKAEKCVGCGWKVEPIKDSVKEQTIELKHTAAIKCRKIFFSVSVFFMMVLVFGMICFMVIVWKRLNSFSAEINTLVSNRPIESEILTNDMGIESEMNIQENEEQRNLGDDNEKEEISSKDSQNRNITNENEKMEKTEEPSQTVVSVDNSNLKFEYTDNKVNNAYVTVYFKIKNEGDVPISLMIQRFHYINDVSIEKAFSKLDDEIPSGKSSLLEICFNREKIEAAGISTIDSFVCQYDIAEDANSENLISNKITFNGLGIDIN